MKSLFVLFFTTTLSIACSAQALISNRDLIDKAKNGVQTALTKFNDCIVQSDAKICIDSLTVNATDEYRKYLIGGMLYNIDTLQSFKLHQDAYLAIPQEQNFILEYAIELHRKRKYGEAAKLYESYSIKEPTDFRVYVWLADCYINIGETSKSIENWKKANHAQNHTSIDFAIYTIYGKADQIDKRNFYRAEIAQGKSPSFYPLVLLDENWEFDWWNSGVQEQFLAADIALAQTKLGAGSNDFKILNAYVSIKKLEETGNATAIKKLLLENNLILDNKPLPQFGSMASDLLRICFVNKLLDEKSFYKTREQELLSLAKQTKDKELLNIYAYLQATVNEHVKPETDLLGWKEFKDERFAISYFIGKAANNRYDDPELTQALTDFPNSAKLYWVKTNCAKIEGKELKPHLVELIKREFRTLSSDESHFSNQLNSYFGYLANDK
jgi:hypothetical protein